MKFWKLIGTDRIIAVAAECQMTPRWMEISMEEFYRLKEERGINES